ncbi:hypothetical protein QZH41_005066 [Actinostola sp. cb2023]|nr:hypothetical protein QZH41_005066 [Actinostola sp. cb2023]
MANSIPLEIANIRRENVNCTRIFTLFALDVLMKAAFGYETNIQNEPNEKFLNSVKNALSVPLWKLAFSMFPFSDHISELLHIQVFRDADYFMDIARTIIASRQKVGSQGRRDLLQLTLQAREEEVAGFPKLSDDELAAQPVAFLIAGFEGTAITLTSTAYLLATNPEVQEKLIQELDKARADRKDTPLYDLAHRIEYLDQVVSEVLRLCSPGFNLTRTCEEEVVIKGVRFPKGVEVSIPIYCLHRDPEAWERPDEFYPEHFTAKAKQKRHPYSYMPFGIGPRQCLGIKFALNEVKTALLTILEKYKFERVPETVKLEHKATVLMLPKNDVVLKIVKREMYSTVADLMKLANVFIYPEEQSLLKPETVREMLLPDFITRDGLWLWGSPWEMRFTNDFVARQKGGNIDTYNAVFSVIPEMKLALSVLVSVAPVLKDEGFTCFKVADFIHATLLPALNQTLFEIHSKASFPISTKPFLGEYFIYQVSMATGKIGKINVTIKQDKDVLQVIPTIAALRENGFVLKYIGKPLLFQGVAKAAIGSPCIFAHLGLFCSVKFDPPGPDGLSMGFNAAAWKIKGVRIDSSNNTPPETNEKELPIPTNRLFFNPPI